METFFNPSSVAIIGATEKPGSLPGIIVKNLLDMGFGGRIYPVNPKYGNVFGLRCFPSILDIPDEIALTVIAVPALFVLDILKQHALKQIHYSIIISAGFREMGPEGIEMEEKIRQIAIENKIRIIGPNCLGVFDNYTNFTTSFLPGERVSKPKKGSLSILSQSGAFAIALLDLATQEGLGIARMINYGNRIDVGESALLPFLTSDSSTKVIALYMESVDHGRKFIEVARACSKKKPIVVLKVGKGEAGIAAAKSHTGAIAGKYEIYKAAFLKSGIIEANGLEEFIDGVKALSMQNPPKGNRILIVTNGGGFGVIVADHCSENGLEVPPPSRQLKEKLRSRLSKFYVVNNPVDLTGSASDEDYRIAIHTCMAESDEYDAAIIIPLMAPQGMTEKVVDHIADTMKVSGKPGVICTVGGVFTMKVKQLLEERMFPVYPSPERSARAMAMLFRRKILQDGVLHSL
ncbi:MAG: CoA-binding protein [Candidatus Jettenia sp.]|uniref:Acetyl-CoA synthase n=1 Tax=Candidatus Jettenia caeni TaxID=247490 RepID=I3IJ83_9BACT|nr:CoA-binding protein [Candidatus Jettenia sp. AMX1]MBC6927511.1 CoA-binding protein [Candidatus Jettenia sp.]WKZ17090.1 MAG: CoA-binding protein [Candidatus Jettenia caeni]KAA0249795.1 MAG: CoA-binding protein [Candidatus Jettenia sp. AMX1]MCE7879192.1 CoA-binding protein [Candidatus Jettenia sp. AMX1]MCQ3925689.1 CoA-binding protein [Candidatus Jettenia sp.]